MILESPIYQRLLLTNAGQLYYCKNCIVDYDYTVFVFLQDNPQKIPHEPMRLLNVTHKTGVSTMHGLYQNYLPVESAPIPVQKLALKLLKKYEKEVIKGNESANPVYGWSVSSTA